MKDRITKALIERCNYSNHAAVLTANDLIAFETEDLKRAVDSWIFHNENPEITEGEFTTTSLMNNHHMTYPAALIFIDWYRESPQDALSSIKHGGR